MSTIKVDQLADEVMKQLNDFADATCDDMKAAVKKAGKHRPGSDQVDSAKPHRSLCQELVSKEHQGKLPRL